MQVCRRGWGCCDFSHFTVWRSVQLDFRTPPGFDRTRNAEIGNKDIKLKHLEEAFTSEHWLVRIYKVKKLENRDRVENKLRGTDSTKQKYTSKKVSSPPQTSDNAPLCSLMAFKEGLNTRCLVLFPLRLPKGSVDTSKTSFPSRRARNWPRSLYREQTANRGTQRIRERGGTNFKPHETFKRNEQQMHNHQMTWGRERLRPPPSERRSLSWCRERRPRRSGFYLRKCDLWPAFLFVLERRGREFALNPGNCSFIHPFNITVMVKIPASLVLTGSQQLPDSFWMCPCYSPNSVCFLRICLSHWEVCHKKEWRNSHITSEFHCRRVKENSQLYYNLENCIILFGDYGHFVLIINWIMLTDIFCIFENLCKAFAKVLLQQSAARGQNPFTSIFTDFFGWSFWLILVDL